LSDFLLLTINVLLTLF